jgi:hypothetical protein
MRNIHIQGYFLQLFKVIISSYFNIESQTVQSYDSTLFKVMIPNCSKLWFQTVQSCHSKLSKVMIPNCSKLWFHSKQFKVMIPGCSELWFKTIQSYLKTINKLFEVIISIYSNWSFQICNFKLLEFNVRYSLWFKTWKQIHFAPQNVHVCMKLEMYWLG